MNSKEDKKIYKEIDKHFEDKRILFMEGEFDEENTSDFRKNLMFMLDKSKTKPITIYIDSYGGDVYSFMSLFSLLRYRKFHLTTIVTGKAMSAGAYLHLLGDERIAYHGSILMLHQMSLWDEEGKLHEMNNHLEICNKEQETMNKFVEEVTGMTNAKEWLEKDRYLQPKEAKKLNIITKIKKVY